MARQQALHQLVTTVAAPSMVLARVDGQVGGPEVGPCGGEGFFHADLRVLAVARLTIGGQPPTPLARHADGATVTHVGLAATAGDDPTQDPQLRVDRTRTLTPGHLTESILLTGLVDADQAYAVELRLGTDAATLSQVRQGDQRTLVAHGAGERDGCVRWERDAAAYALTAPGAQIDLEDPTVIRLRWTGTVAAHGRVELAYDLTCADRGGVVIAARDAGLDVEGLTARLTGALGGEVRAAATAWVRRSLHDLNGLRMATAERPDDPFFAAGSPWYLTLFGRDSLWTARFLVGADVRYAGSTLRTLATLQGSKDDPTTAEAPGKIMHELRRDTLAYGDMRLPPLYYGTIDATALWICLLVDAWRAGLPADQVRALLPNLRAALAWVTGPADADGDGFAEYVDTSGRGLANQGWKDSADSVRFHDGTQAVAPVALCEVQGYAYEAAVGAADLLDELDPTPTASAGLRAWAADLAARFRTSFWFGEGDRRFVALGLDAAKRPIDSVTSNAGHLIGTGLLRADEERLLARHLVAPDLASGLGLRTMSTRDRGYSPLSYHCGSVWPHDTAIVIRGLQKAGLHDAARTLARQLLAAARAWDDRFPELWSGEQRAVPYPAACRPQAWSAAAAVVAVGAL